MVSTDGVDGVITGEANKSRIVTYKQMEQEYTARNKNNIINKFHKNHYNNNLLIQTCETTFVMDYSVCSLLQWLGLGIFRK